MRVNAAAALAASVGIAALYTVAQSSSDLLAPLSDAVFVIVSGACALFALLVVLKWGMRGTFGLVQFGLFSAVFLWFLGEVVWSVYELAFRIPIPYPSLADVFYLAGYLPAILGVLQFLSVFGKELRGLRILLVVMTGLLIIGVTYVSLLRPLITSSVDLLTKTVDVAYPSLDAILLTLAIAMFIVFEGSETSYSWLWISLGLLLTTLADIAFSFGTLEGWYYSGHPIELLWLWGYISLALGFNDQRRGFALGQE